MNNTFWIAFSLEAMAFIGTIIAVVVKYSNKIAILESNQKRTDEDLRRHETYNEKAISKIEDSMSSMNCKLDQLIGFFEGSNGNRLDLRK